MTPEEFKNLFNKSYSRLLILGVIGVLIIAGALIGHRLQQDRHHIAQIKQWEATYGYLETDLTNDFKKAQTDAVGNKTQALGADCRQIEHDSKIAEGKPAIPDTIIESNWKTGLKDDAIGGEACSEATESTVSTSSSEFTEASTSFTNGTKALASVSSEIKALK
jgi:hypothetical protein